MVIAIILLSLFLAGTLAFLLFVMLDSRKILMEKNIAVIERDTLFADYKRIEKQWAHMNAQSNKNSHIYVLGFAFSHDKKRVVLIEKNRPEWQAGLLNGVGGKVMQGETNFQSMQREFAEETGISTTTSQWKLYGCMYGEDYLVYCFTTQLKSHHMPMEVMPGEEQASWNSVREVVDGTDPNVIHNIPWLVSMALDGSVQYANVKNA